MGASDARTPIVVPDVGRTVDMRITLAEWHKKLGQRVVEGNRIAELSTDKANFEVPAPTTGVLVEVAITSGDEVSVGQVIGWIDSVIEPWVSDPPPAQPRAVGRCVYCSALLLPADLRCRNCAALA